MKYSSTAEIIENPSTTNSLSAHSRVGLSASDRLPIKSSIYHCNNNNCDYNSNASGALLQYFNHLKYNNTGPFYYMDFQQKTSSQQLQHYNYFRTTLFNGIYSEDEHLRNIACDNLSSIVKSWAHRLKNSLPISPASASGVKDYICLDSIPSNSSNRISDSQSDTSSASPTLLQKSSSTGGLAGEYNDASMVEEETKIMLHHHLLIILRMSINCPFENVRNRFSVLLEQLRDLGIQVPHPTHNSPSYFIPKEKVIPLDTDDEETRCLMIQCFLSNGRFSNVYRLISYFPSYLEKFHQTHTQIMKQQGPLPRSWRNYIAIMGASQHNCQYLVSLQTREFLQSGGDANWLVGLENAPQKLRNLAQLNSTMAHQPWRLTSVDILKLTRGNDSWSLSELLQAVVVLASYHSLSSFVLGCGIVSEIDMLGGTIACGMKHSNSQQDGLNVATYEAGEDFEQTNELIHRLRNKEELLADEEMQTKIASTEVFEACESLETFNNAVTTMGGEIAEQKAVETPMASTTAALPSPITTKEEKNYNIIFEDLNRFKGNSENELKHVDFNVKSTDYSIFRLQDYNWEEHGCALIGKFLPQVGDHLDEEFSAILNLTDYSLFTINSTYDDEHEPTHSPIVKPAEGIDTWPFRQAIWYYVLRLSGMSHDDYNYHEVNIYLNKRIKQYIKKVACYPEEIVPSDFHKMGFTFRPDEKIQVNLLAAEARKCAELLHVIKCFP